MVREQNDAGIEEWRLPAAELEEGELPEDGVQRALQAETGMEGKVLDFLHRIKPKEGDYRLILIYNCELLPGISPIGYDPRDRQGTPMAFEVAWRSLRNPELRDKYQVILHKAHY
jgi:ADP-ribose pyrophosphatase YjhB (NUDIX family)